MPTQAERRAVTQGALLDATIECLVDYGYAKTTTGRIAEIAGVSRGAQLPYFRSRAEMVTAAIGHLAEKRVSDFSERFGESPTLEECLDALWEGHQGPLFEATLELWVASRTDAELRTDLLRVERRVTAAILRVAESALGARAQEPGFGDDIVFVLATVRGVALLGISSGASSRAIAARWDETRARLVTLLHP